MARPSMRWLIRLNPLKCYDEADWWGSAEPYLWTVFFVCDGSTLRVSDAGTIEGSAVIFPTPGSHGNLNRDSVDAGDSVYIPSELGYFDGTVLPIPIAPSLQDDLKQVDLPGFFGVITVLMEEDNVTDAGAEAGHQALNAAIQNAIDSVLASLGFGHTEITDEDIESVTKGIDDAVSAAIKEQQNIFENIWSKLNPDDQLGNKTFLFNQDQFLTPASPNQRVGSLGFSQRWQTDDGDWELFGAMALLEPCPASSAAAILAGKGRDSNFAGADPVKFSRQLAAMRAFREAHFRKNDCLSDWWNLATRNTAQLSYLMMRDAKVRNSAGVLFNRMEGLLNNLNAPLPPDILEHTRGLIGLAIKSDFPGLRVGAKKLDVMLSQLKPGATGQDALKLFSEISPKKHPARSRQTGKTG